MKSAKTEGRSRRNQVGPKKKGATATKKPVKKTAKKGATARKIGEPRDGSKAAKVIALLSRVDGAKLPEIMDKMGWQAHTVRGFISVLGKTHKVESTKTEKGVRIYRIK